MAEDLVACSIDERILKVVINRPAKHNALSRDVLRSLRQRLDGYGGEPSLTAVLLRGAGTASFAAGGDLVEVNDLRSREDALRFSQLGYLLTDAVRRFPVPVVAFLNGDALGGGAELALACDIVLAAPWVKIGFVQASLNVAPGWGGGRELAARIGPGRAALHMARAKPLKADDALALGIADEIIDCGAGRDETTIAAGLDAWLEPFRRLTPSVARAIKANVIGIKGVLGIPEREAPEMTHFVDAWIDSEHWAASDRIMRKWSHHERQSS